MASFILFNFKTYIFFTVSMLYYWYMLTTADTIVILFLSIYYTWTKIAMPHKIIDFYKMIKYNCQ